MKMKAETKTRVRITTKTMGLKKNLKNPTTLIKTRKTIKTTT